MDDGYLVYPQLWTLREILYKYAEKVERQDVQWNELKTLISDLQSLVDEHEEFNEISQSRSP